MLCIFTNRYIHLLDIADIYIIALMSNSSYQVSLCFKANRAPPAKAMCAAPTVSATA